MDTDAINHLATKVATATIPVATTLAALAQALAVTQSAIEAVLGDGHPTPPTPQVSPKVFADHLSAALTNLRPLKTQLGTLYRPILATAIEQIEQARAALTSSTPPPPLETTTDGYRPHKRRTRHD